MWDISSNWINTPTDQWAEVKQSTVTSSSMHSTTVAPSHIQSSSWLYTYMFWLKLLPATAHQLSRTSLHSYTNIQPIYLLSSATLWNFWLKFFSLAYVHVYYAVVMCTCKLGMWLYTYISNSGLGPYWILLVTLVRVAKWNFHIPLYVHTHTHTCVPIWC